MHPHHPCPPSAGFLVQKIIACEKRHLPCLNAEWCFHSGQIQSVTACGTPSWTALEGCRLRITIPVSVRLCDACGQCTSQAARLELETALPRAFCGAMNDPRNALLLLSGVRLLRADCTCAGCFRVQLAVSLEMYLLRYEAVHGGQPVPHYPQLPLYPQPIC